MEGLCLNSSPHINTITLVCLYFPQLFNWLLLSFLFWLMLGVFFDEVGLMLYFFSHSDSAVECFRRARFVLHDFPALFNVSAGFLSLGFGIFPFIWSHTLFLFFLHVTFNYYGYKYSLWWHCVIWSFSCSIDWMTTMKNLSYILHKWNQEALISILGTGHD